MKPFSPDMMLSDVIYSNYLLLPVVNRLGVPPGFGALTIQTVCERRGIDVSFFLAILNAFSFKDYSPAERLKTDSILPLLAYLEQSHQYYVDTLVPRIEGLLRALLRHGSPTPARVRLISKFFSEYKQELLSHLHREDTVTFPYIRHVCSLFNCRPLSTKEQHAVSAYSMRAYEAEHNNIDDKLEDLKNILIQQVHTTASPDAVTEILAALFGFGRDLQDHTRIEDCVLRPLVTRMERSLGLECRTGRSGRRSRGLPRAQTARRIDRVRSERLHSTEFSPGDAAPDIVRRTGDRTDSIPLTPRELDVLRLVARGYLNKQIAHTLAISLHTVISHRKNITSKLRIRTVAGLTIYALLAGIVRPEPMQ